MIRGLELAQFRLKVLVFADLNCAPVPSLRSGAVGTQRAGGAGFAVEGCVHAKLDIFDLSRRAGDCHVEKVDLEVGFGKRP